MENVEDAPLSRSEFVKILLSTPSNCELRCQASINTLSHFYWVIFSPDLRAVYYTKNSCLFCSVGNQFRLGRSLEAWSTFHKLQNGESKKNRLVECQSIKLLFGESESIRGTYGREYTIRISLLLLKSFKSLKYGMRITLFIRRKYKL